MDSMQLEHFKERLLAEKDRQEAEHGEAGSPGLDTPLTDAGSELLSYDNHPADLGTETFEREKDLAIRNNADDLLDQVNKALERIENGSYGICELCQAEIDPERLEAIPYTTLCIHCRREQEDHRRERERPVEEEFLSPPFGRTFLDETGMAGTDGEDVWQDVAKYGTSESPSDLGGVESYGATFYDAPEHNGIVQAVDAIGDVGPDDIPPDPETLK